MKTADEYVTLAEQKYALAIETQSGPAGAWFLSLAEFYVSLAQVAALAAIKELQTPVYIHSTPPEPYVPYFQPVVVSNRYPSPNGALQG